MRTISNADRARVLLVSPQPFYEDRGTPIAVSYAARALGQLGYDVDLLTFPTGSELPIPGVEVHRAANPFRITTVPVGFSSKKCLLDVGLLRKFEYLLNTRRYAVVHGVEEAGYFASLLCRSRRVPFIYDMASAIPQELQRNALCKLGPIQAVLQSAERKVLRSAAHVICSAGLAPRVRRMAPDTPFTEWRFPVFEHHPAPANVRTLRDTLQLGPNARVMLYIGTFSQYQGLDLLCQAFNAAASIDDRLTLVCVGAADDTQVRHWTEQIRPELRARAHFELRVPRHAVPEYLALASCLISLRPCGNNVPLKLFEYMASGRPIIATRGRAHEALLTDQLAFLCEADGEAVAASMQRVFAHPETARRIGATTRAHAFRLFGWNRFVRLVDDAYESAAAAAQPGWASS